MRRNWLVGWIVAASMLAGCSTTGPFGREKLALPVGPSFVGGRGLQVFPTSENLLTNVKDAMSDVGVHSIRQVPEPNGAIALEATTADNRGCRVTIESTAGQSVVALKVGWFGDEPLTRAFLDRLGTRQGTIPATSGLEEVPGDSAKDTKEHTNPFLSRKAVPDSVMLRDRFDSSTNHGLTPGINP